MKIKSSDIPVQERYCITIEEAAAYTLIGENRLREYIKQNKHAEYLIWTGSTVRIKRPQFEIFLEKVNYL